MWIYYITFLLISSSRPAAHLAPPGPTCWPDLLPRPRHASSVYRLAPHNIGLVIIPAWDRLPAIKSVTRARWSPLLTTLGCGAGRLPCGRNGGECQQLVGDPARVPRRLLPHRPRPRPAVPHPPHPSVQPPGPWWI